LKILYETVQERKEIMLSITETYYLEVIKKILPVYLELVPAQYNKEAKEYFDSLAKDKRKLNEDICTELLYRLTQGIVFDNWQIQRGDII